MSIKQLTTGQKIEAIKSNTRTSILIDEMFDAMEKLQHEGLEKETEELMQKFIDAITTEQKILDNINKRLSLEIIKSF